MTGWLLDRFFAARVSFGLLAIAALGTFLLSGATSLAAGVLAAALIGFGMGGEADITPYVLSRYFGLRSFSVLYGLTWTFYAVAGALGPILMGKAFDVTGSYQALLGETRARHAGRRRARCCSCLATTRRPRGLRWRRADSGRCHGRSHAEVAGEPRRGLCHSASSARDRLP